MTSTFDVSDYNESNFSSMFEDDSDDSLTKPSRAQERPKKSKKSGGKKKSAAHFLKRDIAEGKTFNNSFTGPYPEDTDHLHIDKGANPQFDFLLVQEK